MKTLSDLAKAHGTDKYKHGYTDHVYPKYLTPYLPTRLLEIGVAEGASLRMWDDYFRHSGSRIFGVDRNVPVGEVGRKCLLIKADQSSKDDMDWLASVYKDLNVVIDDGSHLLPDVILTFNCLWPNLTSGGLYFIEDIKTINGRSKGNIHEFVKYLQSDLHLKSPKQSIQFVHLYSNIMVVGKQ